MSKTLNIVLLFIILFIAIFAVKTVKERREEARLREVLAATVTPVTPAASKPKKEIELETNFENFKSLHNAIPDFTKVDKVVNKNGNFLGVTAKAKNLAKFAEEEISPEEKERVAAIFAAAKDAVPDENGKIKAVGMSSYVMVFPKGEAPYFISNLAEDPGEFITRVFVNPEAPTDLVEIRVDKILDSPEGEIMYFPVVFSRDDDHDDNFDAKWYCPMHGAELEKLLESLQ